MTQEELADLRNEIVKLNALVTACADAASILDGNSMKVERVQALLDVAQRYSGTVLMKIEVTDRQPLALVSE